MVTTCFFCQSMLSDYLERLLPNARHEELKNHLADCKQCSEIHEDLRRTLSVAHSIQSRPITVETSLRIAETCQASSRRFSPSVVSRWALLGMVAVLLFGSVAVFFPSLFPALGRWRLGSNESDFVRYFPMVHGAGEIIEEQGNWLRVREPAMRSLWEEGGISPEEFEKSFTGHPDLGEKSDVGEEMN